MNTIEVHLYDVILLNVFYKLNIWIPINEQERELKPPDLRQLITTAHC